MRLILLISSNNNLAANEQRRDVNKHQHNVNQITHCPKVVELQARENRQCTKWNKHKRAGNTNRLDDALLVRNLVRSNLRVSNVAAQRGKCKQAKCKNNYNHDNRIQCSTRGKFTNRCDKSRHLVVLDADLAAATKTGIFKKAYPERHIDCGIAECNMMGIAAGLATTGKIPFVSSFAMFAAGRAFEQVRNSIGYPHLNVKIGATHAGITVGEDGATHQCNEDIALMRTIPGMVVMCPADDVEARAAVRAAVEYDGPVYIRFGRAAVPVINDRPDYKFEIGKGTIVREGTDVTIVATGICVDSALGAAEKLAAEGISAEVINICTIKPLDEDIIIKSAKKTGKVVTAEEHSVIGGLGSAVCDALCKSYPTPVYKIGMQDCFGESGSAAALVQKYKLDAQGVYEQVKEFVNK